MSADFDIAALPYDDIFTNSIIGKRQRSNVWAYLSNNLPQKKSLHILELNCGTGEDACHFAQQGHQVIATDISRKMLEQTLHKATSKGLNIKTQTLDIATISKTNFEYKFDLIFSNFGGLNCLSPEQLQAISLAIPRLLNEKGRFIAVLMPKKCWIESFYFLAKGQFKEAFRRNTTSAIGVNLHGHTVQTWYYSPSNFYDFFQQHFSKKTSIAIGMIPSYLEFLLHKNTFVKNTILGLSNSLFKIHKSGFQADHYLIDLEKK